MCLERTTKPILNRFKDGREVTLNAWRACGVARMPQRGSYCRKRRGMFRWWKPQSHRCNPAGLLPTAMRWAPSGAAVMIERRGRSWSADGVARPGAFFSRTVMCCSWGTCSPWGRTDAQGQVMAGWLVKSYGYDGEGSRG